MEDKVSKKIKANKLEDAFNITNDTTEIVNMERDCELVEYIDYDEKDEEIEASTQEILDKALDMYEMLSTEMNSTNTDTRYLSRLAEVAAGALNTALSASQQKQKLKEHKDKLKFSEKKATEKVVKEAFMSTTADLIAKLSEMKTVNSIDGESKIISNKKE